MKNAKYLILLFCLAPLFLFGQSEVDSRLYGKITTVDGEVYEGFIRWDKNEVNWVDILDGSKHISRRHRRQAEDLGAQRRHSIRILGISIEYDGDDFKSSAQSGIRMGHIVSIRPDGRDNAVITLKSGEEVEFEHGSTDIGTDNRGIIIDDLNEGKISFDWRDIDLVEFMKPRRNASIDRTGRRLFGTLTTRRGLEFTGYVTWDIDEVFTTDILDGEQRGRDREIEFGRIAIIERESSSASRVTLKSGRDMVLSGTNDVDDDNRGILIADAGFGQVQIEWNDFESLEFSDEITHVPYKDFDGGHAMSGTVHTEDGDSYTGLIRWDNDEEYSWELINGDLRDLDFSIELGKIQTLTKKSSRSTIVTLWDGRTFELRGSNDVDRNNDGIFIALKDDEIVMVAWEDFDHVEFSRD